MLRLAALVFSAWLLLTGCTAEQLQHFNAAVAAVNCGLEGKTDCPASGPTQEAAPTAESPAAQPPNLMGAVEAVFEDVTWAQLKGQRRTARNWKVVDAQGEESVANIEIVFVNNYREVTHWCQNVIQAVFGNEHKAHPACGCTRPGPPWRIVVIGVAQPGCPSPPYVLAHELWHTKGNWEHVPDGSWPANSSGESAPRRAPQPQE
jgi:hypothetical protein